MKKRLIKRIVAMVMAAGITVITFAPGVGQILYAKDNTVSIDGKQYELESKSKYAYSNGIVPTTVTSDGSQFGKFTITGDLKSINPVDGYVAYEVTGGTATLIYTPTGKIVSAAETDWHLIEDKGSEINGEKIDDKILGGAVLLQTSIDGKNWITDLVETNVAGNGTKYKPDFYSTPEIQLINGCYYKLIVAYEVERKLDDKKVLFVSVDNEERKKYVEIYEFYLKDTSDAVIAAGAHPNTKKVVGDSTKVTNTGKDNGFSGQNDITNKDPHYGWKLGEFSLNGYTNTADYQGEEYFLKNLGDAVTLTFTLNQDINCLNKNAALTIAEDKNGYDQFFQVPKTNFKHGTLIIRFTDFQGNKTDPIIYTDYLAANVRTGADTRVQFFDEGDYEVALDYEIKDKSGIDSYTDYRMFFTFKIRNGNNMVYAFDKSGLLADNAWTATGFTIGTANSHYLTTTVNKYVVVDGVGGKKLDLSWSRTASDGNTYNDPGVYVVSVSNRYQPNGNVSKTFYVGNDPYIRAIPITGKDIEDLDELIRYTDYGMQDYLDVMSKEKKTIDEIVGLVSQGWTIDAGQLIEPESKLDSVVPAVDGKPIASKEKTETVQVDEKKETKKNEESATGPEKEEKVKKKTNAAPIVVFLAIVASAGGMFYLKNRNKQKSNENGDIKEDETKEGEA